jgi:tetratricopeptide (TPR) repeat protein
MKVSLKATKPRKTFVVMSLAVLRAIWLGLTWTFWTFQKHRRGFNTLEYTTILIPSKWDTYKEEKTRFLIHRGKVLAEAGRFQEATQLLAAANARSNRNFSAKILLAELHLAAKRPDLAKKLLLTQFPQPSDDPSYIEACFRLLSLLREDANILQLSAQSLRSPAPHHSDATQLIAMAAATAAVNLGNYDQAKQILDTHLSTDSEFTTCTLARIDRETSHAELAILRLTHHLEIHPAHDKARAMLASYYYDERRFSEWETALIRHVIAQPTSPLARINYLRLLRHRKDLERERREAKTYLSDFSSDPQALLLLASFAVESAQPHLAKTVEISLSNHRSVARIASLMVIESHIAAREYQPALDLMAHSAAESPEWAAHHASVFNGLRVVAYSALGNETAARQETTALLTQRQVPTQTLLLLADQLSSLSASDLSTLLLNRVLDIHPHHRVALTKLIELQLAAPTIDALPELLTRLIATRNPPRDLVHRAYLALGSDQHLFLPNHEETLVRARRAFVTPAPSL